MIDKNLAAALVLAISGATAFPGTPAAAQSHGRVVHAHGPFGGGYLAGRHVEREPGATTVTRGVRTHGGRGVRQARSTHWGDGAIQNDVHRDYTNGGSVSRNASAVRNGNGSMSTTRNRTGVAGNSQSGWSTIYRTDDGYTRTREASTSRGRGYESTRDVSVGDGSVTVNRNATTNSGRSVTSSRTLPRAN